MAKYEVTFEIEVPDEVSAKDVKDFVAFEVGATGCLDGANALSQKDIHSLNAAGVSVYRR